MRFVCLLGSAVSVLLLIGCSKPATAPTSALAPPPPAPEAVAAPGASAEAPAPTAPVLPQLAYTYEAQVLASADAMPALVSRHEAACRRAGAAVCQVVGAERATDRDGAHAQLKLRAQPAWLQAFRDGLAGDVLALGGKVVSTSTSSEDLSRSLVDTDAALRAKTTLADRLQKLLAERGGKLSDLLDVEKALAETQGEIDTARSELAAMRARVATSDLTLSYTSRPAVAGVWRPVADALQASAGVFGQAVAFLIMAAAALLPFAIVAVAAALLLRAWRRRGRAPATRPPAGDPSAP